PALRLGIPGLFELHFLRKPANYYLVLAVAVLSYVLIRRLVHSRAGRAMIALRENEPLATSVGVDVTRYLVLATMISAGMAGAAELTVEGLTIRFGGLTAVDNVSFEVRAGEVLSLIGPNGAGKTTAFNAITGYIEPAGGEIRYRGVRLTGLEPSAIAALGVVR